MSDPASPMGDQDRTDPAAGDAGADASQPTVLCTISMAQDGSFLVQKGDEDEGEDMGAGDDASKPQTFSDVGPLLKAVMTLAQDAQNSGSGSAQSNFDSGFSGGDAAKPSAPAAKY